MGKLDKADHNALTPGMHADGDGLYLQVRGATSRCWIYRFSLNGQSKNMGLGSFPQVSLEDAREGRNDAYKLVRRGHDPIAERAKQRTMSVEAKVKVPTFREWFEIWIGEAQTGWKHEASASQVRASMEKYVFPVLGSKPMTEVNRTLVIKALQPIWYEIPETARRVRQRIEAVFVHFLARHEKITMANPADRPMIKNAFVGKQKRKKGHYAALPYDQMSVFMPALRSRTSISATCLEFTILTAARTTEARAARWPEIDFDHKTWTIPGERMKNDEEHVVPLSPRALQILRDLYVRRDEGSDQIFAGMRYNEPISNMSMLKLIELMGYAGRATTHGFRATFRTWASETTDYAHEVKEKALSHTLGDETERAYNRGALLEKRRALMNDWADFCATTPAPTALSDNVVRLSNVAAA